jgi:phenylalanyl-tRNA synthetase beta chain
MHETVTWAFMEQGKAKLFAANDLAPLTLSNPISADLSVMRPSALPNLMDAAARNTDRGHPDAALFEIGNVFRSPEPDGQIMTVTGLRSGNAAPRHWSGPARELDAMDAKADALAVLETCGINPASVQVARDVPAWYHPGRSGVLRQGKEILGYFGELHPSVMAELKRDERTAIFEVFLQHVPAAKEKGARKEVVKLSAFQPVSRDFAFVVDQSVEVEKILRAIRGVDRSLITGAEIFDVYAGKGVEPGKKSVALGITLQPVEKTLTDEEIVVLCQKVVEAVAGQGGVLRG